MLRAQRVARHQYDVSEITHFCINVRSCHLQFLLHCCFFRVAAAPYPAYILFSLSLWERVGVRASGLTQSV
ncbi:Uncharacterised protein [Enterobacter cloacae]|nr:Uncharacterised protein [Enterobacter cloacae]